MMTTDYRQDYIISWNTDSYPIPTREGFTKNNLLHYEGKTYLEKIQKMYHLYNEGIQLPENERHIVKVEEIQRTIIFEQK